MKKLYYAVVLLLIACLMLPMACAKPAPAPTPAPTPTPAPAPPPVKPIVVKLSTAYPAGMHVEVACHKLAELAEEKTDGRLIIHIHSAGELYSREEEMMALSTGAIDLMATNSPGLIPVFPNVMALVMPFLWPDYETLRKFEACPEWKAVWEQELEQKFGIKTLCYNAPGGGMIANKVRSVTKPEDYEGLKLRAAGPLDGGLLKHWGAEVVQIPITELWTALEQGMIDGFSTTFGKFPVGLEVEHGKYALKDSFALAEGWIFANAEWWDSLPSDIREIMEKEVIPEVESYSNSELERITKYCITTTTKQGVIWTGFEDLAGVKSSAKAFWAKALKPKISEEIYNKALEMGGTK